MGAHPSVGDDSVTADGFADHTAAMRGVKRMASGMRGLRHASADPEARSAADKKNAAGKPPQCIRAAGAAQKEGGPDVLRRLLEES